MHRVRRAGLLGSLASEFRKMKGRSSRNQFALVCRIAERQISHLSFFRGKMRGRKKNRFLRRTGVVVAQ